MFNGKVFQFLAMVAGFFTGKRAQSISDPGHQASKVYACGSHLGYGSNGLDYNSIRNARRKMHRGKMYKRYRGQRAAGRAYAKA